MPSKLAKLKSVNRRDLQVRDIHKDHDQGTKGEQTSGLVNATQKLYKIYRRLLLEAPPKTDLEKAQAGSFQSFHLANRLIQQLDSWRMAWPDQTSMNLPCLTTTQGSPPSRNDTQLFFTFFLNGSLQIPHEVDLNALFFLTSQFNFAHHWALWILPCLTLMCSQDSSLLTVNTG